VPVVPVHVSQAASLQSDCGATGRIDANQAVEVDLLLTTDSESSLATVPATGEHHGLTLPHVEATLGVQPGGDFQCLPVKRASIRGHR
jgi:hypothetical protein